MSNEEFYEPTRGEIDAAMKIAKREMGEPGEPEPTSENVNRVMKEVAAQFGEKFEAGDPTVPEKDIIERYRKDGWRHVDTITNAAKVNVAHEGGKEIKIIGLGDRFLVFEKEEKQN